MKKLLFLLLAAGLTSCATIFSGSKAKVTVDNDRPVTSPVTLTVDGKNYYNVEFPTKIRIRRGFKPTEITAAAEGYDTATATVHKKFNGTSLWNIIGGGIPGGKKFKAAQTGGPSGGCIPAELIDTPIDYDSLTAIGSMMGSGGLIVMDEDNCMVDIAKFFLEFTVDESCGKCTPCRIGTRRMLEILEKITKGQATMEDLDKLEELCYHLKSNSLCALGQTAPNPVISTLRYFRDEYIAHIVDKKCPAGVCKDLLQYKIDADKCKGCTLCSRVCPAGAIVGSVKEPHMINSEKCLKCGACIEKCRFGAIYKE